MGFVLSLRNDWSKLGLNAVAKSQKVLDKAAQQAFDMSQQLVAVATGELKGSGHIDQPDNMSREIIYGTDHCFFVEFGTRNMAPQPYLVPSMANVANQWAGMLKSILEDSGGSTA